jgi:sulfide:quinone oxidoreductase
MVRVLVAGGGVAGREGLLALRDIAGDRVELTLLSPEEEFVYRPMAVAEPWPMPQTCQAVISASS